MNTLKSKPVKIALRKAIEIFNSLTDMSNGRVAVDGTGRQRIVFEKYKNLEVATLVAIALNLDTLKPHATVFQEACRKRELEKASGFRPDGSLDISVQDMAKIEAEARVLLDKDVEGLKLIDLTGEELKPEENPGPPSLWAGLMPILKFSTPAA